VIDLIWPFTLSPFLYSRAKSSAALLVDLEDHHLDLVAHLHHLGGMHVLVGPVHLGHVHQALDAGLDFDERAVVRQVRDLAEQARSLRIAPGNADPGILAQLLQAEGHAILLGVELEHLGGDFVADVEHFGGVLHPAPGQVGDVQQAVDAAQIDERAVIGDVLDDALDGGAFLQAGEQRLALGAGAGFQHRAARHHHVVPLAVELDDLELHGLAFVGRGVLHRAQVHQRPRQEGTDALGHHRQAALHLAGDHAFDLLALLQRLLQLDPGRHALGLVARQARGAVAVLERLDGHRNEIAGLDLHFTGVVLEFLGRDDRFGLQPGIDHHVIRVDADHLGGDHFADAHLLAREAFLEQRGERLGGGIGNGLRDCGGNACHEKGKPLSAARLCRLPRVKLQKGRPPTQLPFPVPAEDQADGFIDRPFRGIQQQRVRGRRQWRHCPGRIARVALLQVAGKGVQISIHSFVYQLLIPALGPYGGARGQEHFEAGIREYDGAHVPALRHQSRGFAEGSLALQERSPDPRPLGDGGRAGSHPFVAQFVCNILS
jgi:hypothetical protein